jgi:hypothetical protein
MSDAELLDWLLEHACCHYEGFAIECRDTLREAMQMHREQNPPEFDHDAANKERKEREL